MTKSRFSRISKMIAQVYSIIVAVYYINHVGISDYWAKLFWVVVAMICFVGLVTPYFEQARD